MIEPIIYSISSPSSSSPPFDRFSFHTREIMLSIYSIYHYRLRSRKVAKSLLLYTNVKGIYRCGDRIEIVHKNRDSCILLNVRVLRSIQSIKKSILRETTCVQNGPSNSITL